jgi:trigger factor
MKVEIEKTGPFEKKIFFEIPGDVVSNEVESTYRILNRNAKIKGFRPGKVPRSILERYYKTQVETEVAAKLIEDSYGKAVEEYHLSPVAPPSVLDRTFEPGKDFKFSVSVEVKPEIEVEGYEGLEVERPKVVVTDEEVETRLKGLQDSHAQLKPVEVERPVQKGDLVIVDFTGTLDGKPLEGWKVNDHLVEVGSKTLVGALDERLVGLPRGEEREIPLALPQDYSRKELAGKEVKVRVKVKEIKEKILPALDDDFAKEVGEFQTLGELRSRLRKTLEEQAQARTDQGVKEKLLDLLREKHAFPIPQSMLDRQIEHIMARTEVQLARQGLKLNTAGLDTPKIRESLAPNAEKEVRGTLILEKVAAKENISVSDEEVEKKLQELAAQLNQRVEAVKSYYQKQDRMEDLRALLLEEKTLDFLLGKAKITEGPSASPDAASGVPPEEGK